MNLHTDTQAQQDRCYTMPEIIVSQTFQDRLKAKGTKMETLTKFRGLPLGIIIISSGYALKQLKGEQHGL